MKEIFVVSEMMPSTLIKWYLAAGMSNCTCKSLELAEEFNSYPLAETRLNEIKQTGKYYSIDKFFKG